MTYHSDLSRHAPGSTRLVSRRAQRFTAVAALFALAIFTATTAPRADAISDAEELTRFGSEGSAAGQLNVPSGIATDPNTGHVYVSEGGSRIDEFTPWGGFVKAFGWDVATGAVNEQQEVRVRAANGQFKLSFGASTTPNLAFDAPGAESEGPGSIEAALKALPSIGGAGASVGVQAASGTSDGAIPYVYVVTFKGSLAESDIVQLAAANGTTPLSGGNPSTGLEVRTRADGTAGGTGLESCTEESGCKAGLGGAGAGQFASPAGLTVDGGGNIYVRDVGNRRVQKFDSAGRFTLMFGGEVNDTTKANICTKAQLEGGDACGAGTAGAGPGQFADGFVAGVALGPAGKLFVADVGRIQRFSLAGEFEASIPVPGESATVQGIAVDPLGSSLYAYFESESVVHKLDSLTGAEVGMLDASGPLATDSVGHLFTNGTSEGGSPLKILEFNSGGEQSASCCEGELLPPPNLSGSRFEPRALVADAIGDLYVAYTRPGTDSFIRAFGPGPASFEAPPRVAPTISVQFASSVGRNDAVLGAEINPHFWTDTRYYVQYGTGKCSEGGCDSQKPVAPGVSLTSEVSGLLIQSADVFLEGLKAGTAYHYRFVAESSGGGPVVGVEHTFTTYPATTPPKTDCPNQAFRTGVSASLSNCRAYEMVSPVDKNNGDVRALLDVTGYATNLDQSADSGEKFTYSSYRSFGDPKAAPYTNQYLAARDPQNGWSSEAIDVARDARLRTDSFDNAYKAFSADLCSSWLVITAEPVLAPGALEGYRNAYRHTGCGEEGYEALIQVDPTVNGESFYPILQGIAASGDRAIFIAEDKLTPDAPSNLWQAYYASEGGLHLLCILPNGLPSGDRCTGGANDWVERLEFGIGLVQVERFGTLTNAISADGSRVYWTDLGASVVDPNRVYLRINPDQEQSEVSGGACADAEKACTVQVSGTVTSKESLFLGASADGSKALFEITEGAQKGSLYKFDLESAASTQIAGNVLGVAAASEDLSRVYFVSEEAIAGTTGATVGKPNLYLDEEGSVTFIGALSRKDIEGLVPNDADPRTIYHAARASADGSQLAFVSTERLTGYDNTDQVTGEADSQVYLYEAGASEPLCLSCNPSGARPFGRRVNGNASGETLATAGSLPTPTTQFYFQRALSENGQRLFFNSYDALLPRDTNGKADVYEWERATSPQACEQIGAELYVEAAGGCLSLISSGESPQDSEFLDASSSGDDVFFATNASLLPQDPGLIDVYDTRAGGGLPAPPAPPGPCQGEACQVAPPPPNDPTPASASFKGAGSSPPAPRCRKGKVARKGRCVAKKRKQATRRQHKRDANHNRRASR